MGAATGPDILEFIDTSKAPIGPSPDGSYGLPTVFEAGDTVTSSTLDGLAVPVAAVFIDL